MKILGIDPGSRVTGFGLIEVNAQKEVRHISHGVVKAPVTMAFSKRITEIGLGVEELLRKYKPEVVVIEKIFLGKSADSAFKLGHARGVVMYEAEKAGAQVVEYATRLVKKGITGSGAATKEDVQFVLQSLLKLKTISALDASDALALAAFHGFQLQRDIVHGNLIEI